MNENTFIRENKDYHINISPVNQYIEQTTMFVHKRTGKSMEESRSIVKEIMSKSDLKNPIVTYNNRNEFGDVHEETTTLTNYITDNVNKKYTVVPSLTAYEDMNKDKSLHSTFLEKNIAGRNADKKKAFQYKQEKNTVMFNRFNTLQKSKKIANNSLSGAYASISTILYNPSAHYSLTSTTRVATSIANAITESMVAGNKHFGNPDIVLNYIISCINNVDKEKMKLVIDKYNLYIPSTKEVYDTIIRSSSLYWSNIIMEDKIMKLLNSLDDIDRCAITYVNDIYHLRIFNDKLLREIIGDLSKRVEYNTDKPLEVLDNSEEYVLNLVHHICAKDIKGKKVNYKDMIGTDILTILGSTALNINLTLEKYKDLLQVFFSNDVMPINVAHLRDMLRRVTVLSDTDSTCATYQEWIEWYIGEMVVSDIGTAVSASVMTITSQVLEHKLRQFSANMNVPTHLKSVISYKGEYYWKEFAVIADATKHYFAGVAIQEGKVFPETDLEIKGVNLISSNNPMFVQKITKDMMTSINECINNNEKIDLNHYIKIASDLEREITNRLYKGDVTILKTSKIKEASGYKLGPNKSPYIHHMFWEEVLKSKYGVIEEPPYTAVKIPTTLKTKKKMNDFLKTITDDNIKHNFKEFLVKYNKDNIGTFNLPLIYLGEHGVPEELISAINVNRVVFDSLGAIYKILGTIGFRKKDGLTLCELGY